jgi:uncharacterized protein HemX
VSDITKFDASDWITILVPATLAGMGAAMGFFKNSNQKRDEKTGELEKRMKTYEDKGALHNDRLIALEICQQNIQEKMGELKDEIRESAERGAESVNTQLATVLEAVKRIAPYNPRRS